MFWNDDMSKCLSCTICKNQSKTPGCGDCPRECEQGRFWNFDTQRCISCDLCLSHPNTPQCPVCIFTDRTPQYLDIPAWVWILIATVIVVMALTAGAACLKAKVLQPSEAAKPVQEIGIREDVEQQMLTTD
ncbi:uncharacterized protein si:rp71-1c10.7 [Heptranchias perlo]|uniref:uncharacterized protein si:rp71-1c10.7 n=1 Tax=Heptranchias perlo TaxID=212740 RepID=UPI0035594B93